MTHRLRFIVSILLAVVAAQFLHAQEVKQQLPSSIDSISTIVPEPSLIQSEEGVPSLAQANPEDSTQERIDMGYFSPFGRIGVGLYPTPWGIWSPLHEGLNVSLGMSVFAQLGKKALYKGAGFQQGVSMMYVEPVTSRLSVALGGYMNNVTWAHNTLRDAGISAIMGYQFDEHWEAYLYGQKSLVNNANYPMQGLWQNPMLYDMGAIGDRIGAAVKYNITPSFSINVKFEERRKPINRPPLPQPPPDKRP